MVAKTILVALVLLFMFPVCIGVGAAIFGIFAGLMGAIFGIIGGLFGIIGGIFDCLFNWHWNVFTVGLLVLVVVLISRSRKL